MADVLSVGIDFELSFLEDIVSDLKGTFHCILHAGKAEDKKFIKDRQNYFKKKYEKGLYNCLSLESCFVRDAYWKLMDLGKHSSICYNTPDAIREEAREALYNDLMEGISNEEAEDFRNEHSFSLGIVIS